MYTWTRPAIVAATLLAGCTGQIGSPTPGEGRSGSTDSDANATGTTGSPVVDGDGNVDVDGDGTIDGEGIDTDGDGTIDGIDTDGDGNVDQVIDVPETPVSTCTPGIVPFTSQVPLLTNAQYDNTLRHLVGATPTLPSTLLAPDGDIVDQRKWERYQATAATVAAEIMADPTARSQAIPCTPTDTGEACAQQFIAEFGARAFRRPLTTEETATFQNLFTNRATLTETGSFDEAAQLILEGFLVSPSFLARPELTETPEGQYFALSGHEVASRLSYMLWGSMPDDTLLAAATAGELGTKEGILVQAERMLQDPKARAQVASFHRDYAHMGSGTRWAEYSRSADLYPAFQESQIASMSAETERMFDYLVFDQGATFQELMTTTVGFVNADLAPLYALDASQFGNEFEAVELDPATRTGIFTRAGFLAAFSYFDRPSSILRGAFLQKEILCAPIGVPPPDATSTPLPTDPSLTSDRQRVDAQTASAVCANCHHTAINPTGFALGSFDAVGQYQPNENGSPIDTTGEVPMDGTTISVNGPAELMTAISNSPQAQRCYAERWVQYAYQRQTNAADACVVDNMAASMVQGDYTVQQLIADLTQSDSFRLRALEQ
jgi:hypothetical protein